MPAAPARRVCRRAPLGVQRGSGFRAGAPRRQGLPNRRKKIPCPVADCGVIGTQGGRCVQRCLTTSNFSLAPACGGEGRGEGVALQGGKRQNATSPSQTPPIPSPASGRGLG